MTLNQTESHATIFAFSRSGSSYYERSSCSVDSADEGTLFKVYPVTFIDGDWQRSQIGREFFCPGTRVVYVVD